MALWAGPLTWPGRRRGRYIPRRDGTRTEEVWLAPGISQAMTTGSLRLCFLSCLDHFSFGLAPTPAWPARPLVLFQRALFQSRRLLHLGYASARVRL